MEETLAYAVTYLYKDFLAYTTKNLKELGLSFGQLPFVVYAGKHPDCTQAELTDALKIDWGHCQRTVTKLTENGFLLRENLPGDSRCYHLRLTERGEAAFEASRSLFCRWDSSVLTVLSHEEQSQLLKLTDRLIAAERTHYAER